MPHRQRRAGLAGATTLVLVGLALAGCGGSSKSATKAAATTTTPGAAGAGPARFTALRTCLAKNGVNLPARPRTGGGPGAGGGGRGGAGGFFFGGGVGGAAGRGPQLPAGVTQAQFQAALKKCGAANRFGGARRPRPALTPAQRASQTAALVKFAACMRTNGINLPAPNTTGNGPVFNTSKLNPASPAFTAATKKCMSLLPARFGRRGGPGARPAGTATTTTS